MGTYVQQKFTVDNSQWWPITAPVKCNAWTIRCDTAILTTRSDPNDSSTEDTLPAGTPEGAAQPNFAPTPTQANRYNANDTLIYVKAPSSAVVILKVLL